MAPPIANDPWLAGRHFGIVIDAGSSGSRLQIYSWRDPRSMRIEKTSPLAWRLPQVEKGTKNDEQWVSKVEPGISSLAEKPDQVGAYLRPLLAHAREHVPPSLQKDTPLFLLATAGMRLLPPRKQAEILAETCMFLVTHSNFKIEGRSSMGPCGSSVRIITGEEEGLFGWIAVNYLMDGFAGSFKTHNRTTYGFLDMGGASTQIAFEPSLENQKKAKTLMDVRLRLLGGDEIRHKVFVTTWLGYGTNQARERYVGKAITHYDAHKPAEEDENDLDHHLVPDPCLPKDLILKEAPVHTTNPKTAHLMKSHKLIGTGSFEQCLKKTQSLLNQNTPCPDTPCLMNGVHVPPIDFNVSHFIGVSEYWYSSEHIFGLGGAYDFVQYERAASEFCSKPWKEILGDHEDSSRAHRLGGDGEVVENGKIVGTDRWGPDVEIPRLQMQCFKAAWVANVLHEGIKMPRIVDPGGNVTQEDGDKIEDEAMKKGLGRPTFQSMDSVGNIAITWTLGKMVIEASKEVPPRVKKAKPIVDPIEDIEDLTDFPIQPIRPPFFSIGGLEQRITPHLPTSLHRDSLGFSPVLFLFWVFLVLCLVFVVYPLRRTLRASCLRTVRYASTKREGTYGDMMEEGRSLTGGGGGFLRRLFGGPVNSSRPKYPLSVSTSTNPILRHILPGSNSTRPSPTRSHSYPNISNASNGHPNGSSNGANSNIPLVQTSQYISRSPSPSVGNGFDDTSINLSLSASQALMTSRSRNASQISLGLSGGGSGGHGGPPRGIALSRSMNGRLSGE